MLRPKLNVNLPSRHDVDLAIRALQIEDEREEKAWRDYYDRQRYASWRIVLGWRKFWAWKPPLAIRLVVEALALLIAVFVFCILWMLLPLGK